MRKVALEWGAKRLREGLSPRTVRKIDWMLRETYPAIRGKPIGEIEPTDILPVLRRVEGKVPSIPRSVSDRIAGRYSATRSPRGGLGARRRLT